MKNFFFFLFCSEHCPLKIPFPLSLIIFSSPFYTWFSLGAVSWTKFYFSRPFPSKKKKNDHFCIRLDFSEFSGLCQGFDQVKPLCRVHESQWPPWWAGLLQKSVHHKVWATAFMCIWQLSWLPFAGSWNDSSTVTTYVIRPCLFHMNFMWTKWLVMSIYTTKSKFKRIPKIKPKL